MAAMSRTLSATVEQLIAVASLFWLLAANRLFFDAALQGQPMAEAGTWGFAFALAIGVFGLHFLLLSVLANRWTVKPLLALLIVLTALTAYYMQSFGIYLDPTMIRNVLRTDLAEARELWSWSLLPHLALYAGLPLWLLSRVRVVQRPWPRSLAVRAAAIAGAVHSPAARPPPADPRQRLLWAPLADGPLPAEALAARAGLTMGEASSILLLMELEGHVVADGGRFLRKP